MMQLDDNELRKLIEAILTVLKSQREIDNAAVCKTEISVLFSAPWDNRFYTFADGMKTKKNCCFRGYVSPELPEQAISTIKKLADWESVEVWDYNKLLHLENSISVFPVTRRDTIIKTALCISDTYETKWIRAAMEQGSRIVLPRNGFERFTGLEPEKYKQNILSYYKELLEMDIELPESFEKYIV